MFPVGIVGTVKSYFFLETMMHVTTLLIIFLFSAAAFEPDEELFKMMRAATENLCAFDIANSPILDIKADIKNLNNDMIEGIRNIENLSQVMNKKVQNLSEEIENLSEEFMNLRQDFEKDGLSNEGVKKSIQDLIARVAP